MTKMFDRWTDEELEELRGRFISFEPYRQIAERMGRTHQAIVAKIREKRAEWGDRPILEKHVGRPPQLLTAAPVDDEKHVRSVLMRGGFSWLRPDIANRLYELEKPFTRSRAA